ncbi:MAG: hypothetical protein FWD57_11765, partial [Polyangiaceae bacterium]|nr:hypothetical protein [Polyangiaceae bacterium]
FSNLLFLELTNPAERAGGIKDKPAYLSITPYAARPPRDASLTGCSIRGTTFSTEQCIPTGCWFSNLLFLELTNPTERAGGIKEKPAYLTITPYAATLPLSHSIRVGFLGRELPSDAFLTGREVLQLPPKPNRQTAAMQ